MLIYILMYILSAVLCLAVGIMLSYHLWTVASGETSVESQDHDVYRDVAKSRGDVSPSTVVLSVFVPFTALILRQTFVNSYDLGYIISSPCDGLRLTCLSVRKLKNLKMFFNIGKNG